jgi:hypothetical protein
MTNPGFDSSVITYVEDYNLQTYVPIPKTGEIPITLVNSRVDLDVTVVWMDLTNTELTALGSFQEHTVYKAKIQLTAKPGYTFNPDIAFEYLPGKITSQETDTGDPTRTVRVTYNDSNDADFTFITDYNLQSYVPVPIAGEKPVRTVNTREDMTIEVKWKAEDSPGSDNFIPIDTADTFAFNLGTIYKAEITLATKQNYRFREGNNFTYIDRSETTPIGSETDPGERQFQVIYMPTRAPVMIRDYNLTPYVTKPVGGATPVMSFAASQYTGRVSWRNAASQEVLTGPFQYGTAYTADLILTANSGYTIDGIGENIFIHTGARTITNAAGSGAISIGFLPTSNAPSSIVVYDTLLTNRIPKPVNRATAVTSFTAGQYTGTVIWKNTITQAVLSGSFVLGTSYTAVVTLHAVAGYTFTGIGRNVFSHGDVLVGGITNSADSGVVTINFPPAGPSTQQAMSFGPVDAEGSALKLMKDRKDDNNPVTIELPGNATEPVIPNSVVLQEDYSSPINITINGHQRVLKIEEPGILITVNSGITLTLLNITLQGMKGNNSPLVRVRPGGKLILGDGAVITGNEGSGVAGGVWVDGGSLIMNPGSVIKKMKATGNVTYFPGMAGGVTVGSNGIFTMLGGTIGGTNSSDGNIYSDGGFLGSIGGAGAVTVFGIFDMYGGTIENNSSDNVYGIVTGASGYNAGGVFLENGVFNMHGGAIRRNRAEMRGVMGEYASIRLVGGVAATTDGVFTMNGANAIIEDNSAEGQAVEENISAMIVGGVWAYDFRIINGSIQRNTAQGGPYSIGGVFVQERFIMTGGTIGGDSFGDANIGKSVNGVYAGRQTTMSGGTIKGNTGSDNNYGLYIMSPYVQFISEYFFVMSGTARIHENNPVFLNTNAMITVGGNLSHSPAANIICADPPTNGTRLLKANTSQLIQDNAARFTYNGVGHINDAPEDSDGIYYGTYQE